MSIEQTVGQLALDLIDIMRPAFEAEGDDMAAFDITGALLFVVAEDKTGDGWHFTASVPESQASKLGLTEMAHKYARSSDN